MGEDFNPNAFRCAENAEPDSDADDNIIILGQRNVTSFPGISPEDAQQLRRVERLDGIVVISETMAVGVNSGSFQISSYPQVFHNHVDRYKGLQPFFGRRPKHIYEFSLGITGVGVTLSAIIATNETVGDKLRPDFTKMIKAYHEIIRKCIEKLDHGSHTYRTVSTAPNTAIHIYREDWPTVCEMLVTELPQEALARRAVNERLFPPSPKFYWLAKVLGQHLAHDTDNEADISRAYRYAINLDLNYPYHVAVHCALDLELDEHVLLFNPVKISKALRTLPNPKVYFAGLLPGTANVTFDNINRDNFSSLQYYSKLFASCHKDPHHPFVGNTITKRLYNRYISKLKNATPKKMVRNDGFMNDTAGAFDNLLTALQHTCTTTTPARIEAVWTYSAQDKIPIDDVLRRAFERFRHLVSDRSSGHVFNEDMLVKFTTQTMSQNLKPLIQACGKTLTTLSDKVQIVEQQSSLWAMDTSHLIEQEKFCAALVSEWILHMLIKGKTDRSFPAAMQRHLGITDAFLINSGNYSTEEDDSWIFQNIIINDGGEIEAVTPGDLTKVLDVMTGIELQDNMFFTFAMARKQFLQSAPQDIRTPACRIILSDFAKHLVNLMIFVQKQKYSTGYWGKIELKSLFLERKDFTRNNKHVSVSDFIDMLSNTSRVRISKSQDTADLCKVMDTLRTDIPRFRYFKEYVVQQMEAMIRSENVPFRFTFGKRDEVYVYANLEQFPPSDDELAILRRGIVDTNSGKANQLPVSTTILVRTCQDWLKINNYGNFSDVAASLQDILDKKKVRATRHIHADLKKELLGLLPAQPNANDDDGGDDDDDDGSMDTESDQEPQHGPVPGSSRSRGASAGGANLKSVKKKIARKRSETRSKSNSRAARIMWAVRKGIPLQNSPAGTDDSNSS